MSLKSFFFEEDEPTTASTPARIPSGVSTTVKAVKQTTGAFDEKLYNDIMSTVEGSNEKFSRFFDMINSLKDAIPDEKTRYSSAFIAVKKMGNLSAQDIVNSISECLGTLDSEAAKMDEAINEKQKEVEDLKSGIESKDKTIKSLQQQIAEIEAEKQQLVNSINIEEQKITTAQSSFNAVKEVIVKNLNDTKAKVTTYLK